MEHFGNMA